MLLVPHGPSSSAKHPCFASVGRSTPSPAEVEYDTAVQIAGLPFKEAMHLLLGDEQFERFWAHKPTAADVLAIDEWLGELWKVGESPASSTP